MNTAATVFSLLLFSSNEEDWEVMSILMSSNAIILCCVFVVHRYVTSCYKVSPLSPEPQYRLPAEGFVDGNPTCPCIIRCASSAKTGESVVIPVIILMKTHSLAEPDPYTKSGETGSAR